eukprot:TRINITY_DN24822_c0_g1_i2.p1 TRINITY_DN24822_c0_g1~~TRINITY_DN24822_c0_g1_i2.p1  ORF type:complete len:291 (-),score=72.61 TRINITY_DN24822_c0_g1_i2:19-858(-)
MVLKDTEPAIENLKTAFEGLLTVFAQQQRKLEDQEAHLHDETQNLRVQQEKAAQMMQSAEKCLAEAQEIRNAASAERAVLQDATNRIERAAQLVSSHATHGSGTFSAGSNSEPPPRKPQPPPGQPPVRETIPAHPAPVQTGQPQQSPTSQDAYTLAPDVCQPPTFANPSGLSSPSPSLPAHTPSPNQDMQQVNGYGTSVSGFDNETRYSTEQQPLFKDSPAPLQNPSRTSPEPMQKQPPIAGNFAPAADGIPTKSPNYKVRAGAESSFLSLEHGLLFIL